MGFEIQTRLNRIRRESAGIDPVLATYRGYRSQCKRCERAILVTQKADWQTGPLIGLVHRECP